MNRPVRRNNNLLIEEKMRLLDESLKIIERLKKMRAVGARPRSVGIDPHILKVSGLYYHNIDRLGRPGRRK